MTANGINWFGKLAIAIPLALSGATIGSSDSVLAQIVPDASLGQNNSVVTPLNPQMDRIDGGAIRGTNLFHSFREFNIGEGRGAYFANPAGIGAIFSRVTGGNPSQLLGTLGVLGDANLYFINPNGIIFGPNARLDIRGSFVASTASSLVFPNGTRFSATNPNAPPLLTVNVPVTVGLQFEAEQPGAIVNAGNLGVRSGQNLTLVGGTAVNTGQLSAPGGEVAVLAVPGGMANGGMPVVQLGQAGQLLSMSSISNPQSSSSHPLTLSELLTSAGSITGLTVSDNGEVKLTGTGTRIPTDAGTTVVSGSVDVSGNTAGKVQILGDKVGLFNANINASGNNGGGTVLIGGNYQGSGSVLNASRTLVTNDSVINANALTSGDGGRVIVWADKTTGFYGNINARGGSNSGNGGFVEVSGKENLIFRGQVDTDAPNGNFGTLLLDPTNITISASNETPGVADAMPDILQNEFAGTNITISRSTLESQLGNVVLQATNDIIINPDVSLNFLTSLNPFPSGSITFTADADNSGVGAFLNRGGTIDTNGRDIAISGANITTGNIDSFSSDTDGGGSRNVAGKGGTITLNALGNISTGNLNSSSFALGLGSGNATATGGAITLNALGNISTGNLNSSSSSYAFARLGSANATGGAITLNALGNISTGSLNSSGLAFASSGLSSGSGGKISLTSTNGAINTTAGILEATGVTQGGDITLSAKGDIITGSGSSITNSISIPGIPGVPGSYGILSAGQVGGNITLSSGGAISVPNGDIASITGGSGTGGGINLTARSVSVSNNAKVGTATLGAGQGGTVRINASDSVFLTGIGGIQPFINSLRGRNLSNLSDLPSGLFAISNGTGKAGDLQIETGQLIVQNGAAVLASTLGNGQGGTLDVKATNSVIVNNSAILTGTLGDGNAGNLTINTPSLTVQDRAVVATSTVGAGNAGNLTITSGLVTVNNQAGIGADTRGSGDAGDLTITTGQLNVFNGSGVSVSSLSTDVNAGQAGTLTVNASELVRLSGLSGLLGQTRSAKPAGDININTRQLLVEKGAVVAASTSRLGLGGNINVNATDSVELIGTSTDGLIPSALFTGTSGEGKGGNIGINTQQLIVRDGAVVSSTTAPNSKGRGGDLIVNASDSVILSGTSANNQIPSGFSVDGAGTGAAGNLIVNTRRFVAENGAGASASTFSPSATGLGGNIIVNASESVELRGTSSDGLIPSGLYAQTFSNANAGNLDITTGKLSVRDRARVSVSGAGSADVGNVRSRVNTVIDGVNQTTGSQLEKIPDNLQGSGNAGKITVTADTIFLNNQGQIVGESRSGKGGDIALKVNHLLLMRYNSEISATAGNENTGGDGGNIKISAPFIIGVPRENSDITANAFTGTGGNIRISTQAIFGLKFRPKRTPLSDITVSSEFGVDGIFELNTLGIDPSRGLVKLPEEPVNPEIAEGCQAGGGQAKVEFFNTGQGGLPPGPDEPFNSDMGITDGISHDSETEKGADSATTMNLPHSGEETQTGVSSSAGEAVRAGQASTTTSQLTPPCQRR